MSDEIRLEPETIQKLADILTEEVCEPLKKAAELVEQAKTEFYNWNTNFSKADYAHAACKQVTIQNIESISEKTIKDEIGEKLHITGKNWKEAEQKSTVKKA